MGGEATCFVLSAPSPSSSKNSHFQPPIHGLGIAPLSFLPPWEQGRDREGSMYPSAFPLTVPFLTQRKDLSQLYLDSLCGQTQVCPL